MVRVELTGSFHLAIAPDQAMALFTASGERAWAPGWDPVGDDDCWQTTAEGTTTYWLTVERTSRSARYARITPGDTSGTVAVSCTPNGDGTDVTVTYGLTSTGEQGERRLPQFASDYPSMLNEWQRLISALI